MLLGQWASEDPIGFHGDDENLRRYVRNKPTLATDPTGLEEPSWWSGYGHYLVHEDGWLAGMGSALGQVAKSFDPRELVEGGKRAFDPAGYAEDGKRLRALIDDPGGYLNRRYQVICDGVREQFSTPAGWGEAYVYISGALIAKKVGQGFSARPVPKGYTRVYRAVSEAEYQDILKTRRLRPGPNSLEGKWFADTPEGARLHGNALEGAGKFRIIEVDVPDNAASLFRQPNLDGRGPARYLHCDDLKNSVPRPIDGG